jgi:hypothetical protein
VKAPYFTKKHEVLVDGSLTGEEALLIMGKVYVPLNIVQNRLMGLYPESMQLIMTTNQDIMVISV